jgi:hypothetical protein
MTKQEQLIASLTKVPPNRLKTGWIGRLFWGINWADDYWANNLPNKFIRQYFCIEKHTTGDDELFSVVIFKLRLMFSILPKKVVDTQSQKG